MRKENGSKENLKKKNASVLRHHHGLLVYHILESASIQISNCRYARRLARERQLSIENLSVGLVVFELYYRNPRVLLLIFRATIKHWSSFVEHLLERNNRYLVINFQLQKYIMKYYGFVGIFFTQRSDGNQDNMQDVTENPFKIIIDME